MPEFFKLSKCPMGYYWNITVEVFFRYIEIIAARVLRCTDAFLQQIILVEYIEQFNISLILTFLDYEVISLLRPHFLLPLPSFSDVFLIDSLNRSLRYSNSKSFSCFIVCRMSKSSSLRIRRAEKTG